MLARTFVNDDGVDARFALGADKIGGHAKGFHHDLDFVANRPRRQAQRQAGDPHPAQDPGSIGRFAAQAVNRAGGAQGCVDYQFWDKNRQINRGIGCQRDDHPDQSSLKSAMAASISALSSRSMGLAPKCCDIIMT